MIQVKGHIQFQGLLIFQDYRQSKDVGGAARSLEHHEHLPGPSYSHWTSSLTQSNRQGI